MGISKRGSQHLLSLLVHGARAVVRTAPSKMDPNNNWVNQLRERRGFNRATVAVANKNARIIWAVLQLASRTALLSEDPPRAFFFCETTEKKKIKELHRSGRRAKRA